MTARMTNLTEGLVGGGAGSMSGPGPWRRDCSWH
jgi:hypothetical protein